MDTDEFDRQLSEVSKLISSASMASSGRSAMSQVLVKLDAEMMRSTGGVDNATLDAIARGISVMVSANADDLAGALRDRLGRLYERESRWLEVIKTLTDSSFDSGTIQQQLSLAPPSSTLINLDAESYKLELNLRIARAYLHLGDHTAAESFLNRAALLFSVSSSRGSSVMSLPLLSCNNSASGRGADAVDNTVYQLKVDYTASQAAVCDLKGQYLKAANLYFELAGVDQYKHDAFTKSGLCALLAPPTEQQARFLTKWYQDFRCAEFANDIKFCALSQTVQFVRLVKLVPANILADLRQLLLPHHLVAICSGSSIEMSVFKQALIQHNIVAVSKLYSSVAFTRLASLLNASVDEVKYVSRQLVEAKLLNAQIDQISDLLLLGAPTEESLYNFVEKRIGKLCFQVESISEALASKEYVKSQSGNTEATVPCGAV